MNNDQEQEEITIESLEVNLLKASEINDNDIIIVKIDDDFKSKLNNDKVHQIYKDIQKMVNKNISIYFFPKTLDVSIVKNHIKNMENSKSKIVSEINKKNEN